MLQFKSKEDLQQLPEDDAAYPIVAELVQSLITNYEAEGYAYDPEADGWVVLIEESDVDGPLKDIWDGDTKLTDLFWEGFSKQDDHFIGIFLANNQWGLAAVIPDEPWVNGELRRVIADNLDPPLQQTEGLR